ncbi:UDP-Glc/Gal endoplasmic reticulum nucleotide sugar transporter [Metarhizium album ARSEF 1941]|uniref:UDP-galactose transporter homolog 1 n=1 Tax=Metarhizium album (strain ARSEF 1941) TaxID=1081103 RepID=A0A0B2WQD4_METAS|nr:UDP-Glc/Gal endoplasmic reticulum nucleotide sugar transporter [Metarhizium album ARSEF 1941]KHN96233.1 UDP-Glc/Gal endoplasmic reticulum nucleotide sugar transporter [Metarhizium album ARSEF 1941]
MARTKRVPVRRESSSEFFDKQAASWVDTNGGADKSRAANGHATVANGPGPGPALDAAKPEAGVVQLFISVAGIYASFLTWAYLQEKLTTRPHGSAAAPERWHFPVFLNTIQSLFAAAVGSIYLLVSTPKGSPIPPIMPSRGILGPLALVAVTSSLASPFGYASLAHIDYITFLLAKSCKLLPVMFLHITIFRKRYPIYKYLVVAAVTAGVAVFTLHSGKKSKKSAKSQEANVVWGLLLLGINLLFDGLTNSTQDYIFQTFRPYTGPQMMCANNMMSTLVTGLYLVTSPYLVATGVGEWLGMDAAGSAGELTAALDFMRRHPAVWKDVLGFAACGAIGQVFIFYTLSTFSSVLLVTVTVTRKMFTMILSVVAFGHRLTHMQWLGVGLVFGGIGVEAAIARQEKMAKEAAKKAAAAKKDF